MDTRIRLATEADANAINAIYNYYVKKSTCTWHLTEETLEGRKKWFRNRKSCHPVVVLESESGIVGWGSLSPYNSREGWSKTVEDSIFINHLHHRKGYGKQLLEALLKRAEALGHLAVIARISAEQTASIELHESLGFKQAGVLFGVGQKFGQELDCVYMLKSLRKP